MQISAFIAVLPRLSGIFTLMANQPDFINMKPGINNQELDHVQKNSSELMLQESVDGDPGSRKKKSSTKTSPEILILSPVEESVKGFCRKLMYRKKSINVSDESSSNTDCKRSTSSNSSETLQKKFICKLCGIEYCRIANLRSHMRIHTGETPYDCKLCGKTFQRVDYLRLHNKIHTGEKRLREKRFVCELCGKKFGASTSLQDHMWKHSGERPYACSVCEKTFFSERCLRTHKNDCHSGARDHICFICGRGFKRLDTLQKHTRIHTGEKPFSCSQCGKFFAYKYSLCVHIKQESCKKRRT